MREAGGGRGRNDFGWSALGYRLAALFVGLRSAAKPGRVCAGDSHPVLPPPMRKTAMIEAFRAFTKIYRQAVYGTSYPDPKDSERILPSHMDDLTLGREARAALDASRFIGPDHPEWNDMLDGFNDEAVKAADARDMARAGVRSLKALFSGASCADLELRDGLIEIRAWRYAGRGGWEGTPGLKPTTLPESVSDEELGAAINAALEVSRNA